MPEININPEKSLFLIKEYRAVYNIAASARIHLNNADFGITDIPGYTVFGVHEYDPGHFHHQFYTINPFTDNNRYSIYNYETLAHDDVTAILWLVWIRNDAVSDDTGSIFA